MIRISLGIGDALALIGLGLAALAVPGKLWAQDELDIAAAPAGTTAYQIVLENDALANTDRGYTNGLQLSRIRSARTELPWWSGPLRGRFRLCVDDDSVDSCYNVRSGFLFGQLMYTPENISLRRRIPDDRPYAGWLYGGVVTELLDQAATHSHRFEIDVGVLGPESQADDAQIFIHDTFGFTEPRGWANQIDTRLGVVLQYDYRRALIRKDLAGSGARLFDLSGAAGVTAGNIFTNVHLSAIARLGYNLSDIFPETISPVGIDASDVEVYVFAGATARGVLINETIEGHPLHRVDAESFVNDVSWGGVVRVGGYRLQFVIVTRSPEYTPSSRQHRYGSVGLSWNKSF